MKHDLHDTVYAIIKKHHKLGGGRYASNAVKELNSLGYKTPSGRPWTNVLVYTFVRRFFVLGKPKQVRTHRVLKRDSSSLMTLASSILTHKSLTQSKRLKMLKTLLGDV